MAAQPVKFTEYIPFQQRDRYYLHLQSQEIEDECQKIKKDLEVYDAQLEELKKRYDDERRLIEAAQSPYLTQLEELKDTKSKLEQWKESELEAVLSRFEQRVPEQFPRTSEYRTVSAKFTEVYADIFDLPKYIQEKYFKQLGHLFTCRVQKTIYRSVTLDSGKQFKKGTQVSAHSVILVGHPKFTREELDILSKYHARVVYVDYDIYSKPQYTISSRITIKDS